MGSIQSIYSVLFLFSITLTFPPNQSENGRDYCETIVVFFLFFFSFFFGPSSMQKEEALLELCDVMAFLVLLTLCRDSGGPHQETVQTLHCGLLRQLHLVQVQHVTATQLHSSPSLHISFHLNKSEKSFGSCCHLKAQSRQCTCLRL